MQLANNPVIGYFRGVISELRRVTWPTPMAMLRNLVSVVLGIGLATLLVALVDFLLFKALGFFITR
jgi:preprotein translocase SecE subunit